MIDLHFNANSDPLRGQQQVRPVRLADAIHSVHPWTEDESGDYVFDEPLKFKDRPEDVQSRAIDEYRMINVEDSWWSDNTSEDFQENTLSALGIEGKNHEWNMNPSDSAWDFSIVDYGAFSKALWKYVGRTGRTQWPQNPRSVFRALMEGNISVSWKHSSLRGSGTAYVEDYTGLAEQYPRVRFNWDDALSNLESVCDAYFNELESKFSSTITNEYEYLTGDEAVRESLIANEYTFDERGTMSAARLMFPKVADALTQMRAMDDGVRDIRDLTENAWPWQIWRTQRSTQEGGPFLFIVDPTVGQTIERSREQGVQFAHAFWSRTDDNREYIRAWAAAEGAEYPASVWPSDLPARLVLTNWQYLLKDDLDAQGASAFAHRLDLTFTKKSGILNVRGEHEDDNEADRKDSNRGNASADQDSGCRRAQAGQSQGMGTGIPEETRAEVCEAQIRFADVLNSPGVQRPPVVYPTVQQLVDLNEVVMEAEGRPVALRAETTDLLEAAIGRMQSGFGDYETFPTLVEKAAALLHSIVTTHAFVDGCKRTSILAALLFLRMNGVDEQMVDRLMGTPDADLADLTIAVAEHRVTHEDLVRWFSTGQRQAPGAIQASLKFSDAIRLLAPSVGSEFKFNSPDSEVTWTITQLGTRKELIYSVPRGAHEYNQILGLPGNTPVAVLYADGGDGQPMFRPVDVLLSSEWISPAEWTARYGQNVRRTRMAELQLRFGDALDLVRHEEHRICTSYSVVTPESAEQGDYAETGWENEEGELIEIDEAELWDAIADGQVLDATEFLAKETVWWLRRNGAAEYAGNPTTYYGEPFIENYGTGEEKQLGFHLHGYTDDELTAVAREWNTAMEIGRRHGRLKFSTSAVDDDSIVSDQPVETSPSEAQIESGNYRKGHTRLHGLDITIENPKGSTRHGEDAQGNKWSVVMTHDYGYIVRVLKNDN